MKRRHRKPAPPRHPPPRQAEPGLPALEVLEEFTQASLAAWRVAARNLEQLSQEMFFGLEARRSRHSRELVDAILAASSGLSDFQGWARLVDYQYTNQPLSVAGSIKGDGGRFNIGAALDPATHTPFPALYVAEDFPTAYKERFGIEQGDSEGGLPASELILRRDASFSHVALNIRLETLIDVGDMHALKPIAEILARIQMPAGVGQLARRLRLRTPGLVRTPSSLQRQLLHPQWRIHPAQYDLPANSQIFGRLCSAAGIHGILYPSARNSHRRCLALFPQNWRGSGSFVELIGPCPEEVQVRRIDGEAATSS